MLPVIAIKEKASKRSNILLPSVAICVIGILVYGVYAASLGFYWDDWPVVWVYNALGSRGVSAYFSGQRPVYGWIIANVAHLIGTAPLGWHLASSIVRCLSSVMLFLTFSTLWPKRRDISWTLASIVLLYPGFTLQPIALGFLEYHLSFFFFALSLWATISSIRSRSWRGPLIALGLASEGISYVIIEYFVGLELFRLLVMLVAKKRVGNPILEKQNVKETFVAWLPYAAVWMGYALWRVFVFHTVSSYGKTIMDPGFDMASILHRPVQELVARVGIGMHNILVAGALAWARPFGPDFIKLGSISAALSWGIATVVLGIAIYVTRGISISADYLEHAGSSKETGDVAKTGLMLGLFGLVVAGVPLMLSRITADFTSHPSYSDRFTLSFMLPASLAFVCFFAALGVRKLFRAVVLLMLFGLSVFQLENGNAYRHEWLTEKTLFWQMAWRAPVLKPGTSILADGVPPSLYGNHSSGMLDMLYGTDDSAGRLQYAVFDLGQLSTGGAVWANGQGSFRSRSPLSERVRSFEFQGSTDQSVVAWISPTGTFRIVTPALSHEVLRGSAVCLNIASLSQPDKVISDAPGSPSGPLLKIFGKEPKHDWLYFYQRAELERQLGHWNGVVALADKAVHDGFEPTDASEWFPFIEGYARTGRYHDAAILSDKVLAEAPDGLFALGTIWQRAKEEGGSPDLDGIAQKFQSSLWSPGPTGQMISH